MRPRAVYIIGGSGSGKSTAMAHLLEVTGVELGEFTTLWSTHFTNRKVPATVRLRGHRFPGGVYIGLMRDEFPGADGLDNAAGPVFREWLGEGDLPPLILGEGLVFASEASLLALHEHTDLLVLYLHAPPEEIARRQAARSHQLEERWVAQTVSRAANLAVKLRAAGVRVAENDLDSAVLHACGI